MNYKVNYVDYNKENKNAIVFLHGWGQNIAMMESVANPYKNSFRVIILDLPGFGESDEPKSPWTVYDYAEFLHEFLIDLGVEKPILVGHSFGGKLALLYASKYEVKKLVLFAPTFKKEVKKLSLKTKVLKKLKKVPFLNHFEEFAKKHIGSTDYRNASGVMREILTCHVNTDISEECKKIKAPTLLIWGTLDEAVPYERAFELESLIEDAGVVTLEGCTHYAYLEKLGQTISILNSFFNMKGE